MRFVIGTALVLCAGAAAAKEGNCMARIIADVAAEEAPEQVKSKSNGEFGPITQIKVDRSSGKMLFCSANSYCYNSNAFEMVSNCRIKRDESLTDSRYFSFFTR